jgi:putative endonuclease
MDLKNKRSQGSIGEEIAINYLRSCGFYIMKKNFRVGKLGEIDIIAREKEYICFLEVKSRKSLKFGTPAEAVNRKKQENIKKLASIYIKQHNLYQCCIRFDIVEVMLLDNGLEAKEINLIRNAF